MNKTEFLNFIINKNNFSFLPRNIEAVYNELTIEDFNFFKTLNPNISFVIIFDILKYEQQDNKKIELNQNIKNTVLQYLKENKCIDVSQYLFEKEKIQSNFFIQEAFLSIYKYEINIIENMSLEQLLNYKAKNPNLLDNVEKRFLQIVSEYDEKTQGKIEVVLSDNHLWNLFVKNNQPHVLNKFDIFLDVEHYSPLLYNFYEAQIPNKLKNNLSKSSNGIIAYYAYYDDILNLPPSQIAWNLSSANNGKNKNDFIKKLQSNWKKYIKHVS